MKNWSAVNRKINYFLSDKLREKVGGEVSPRLLPLPLRIDGWNWAQDIFCAHTPRQRRATLTIGQGNRTAMLPDDFYAVKGLYDESDEIWWRKMEVDPGDIRYRDDDLPEYWVWGDTMYLEQSIAHGANHLKLHYWAYYPEIEYEVGETDEDITYGQETVYTPEWAEIALMHLVAAFGMQPGAIEASDINQWKTRIDSGDPLDNPRAQQAREFVWWYHEILKDFPPAMGAK